jgi:hypothetical protein
VLAVPAHASGWLAYYDCGNGVVPIFGGWHGKYWLTVEGNRKVILDEGIFRNDGTATKDGTDGEIKEDPLDADKNDFSFRVKWRGKTTILRWRVSDATGTSEAKVTFGGRACRPMGDSRYEGEAQKYEEEKHA